MQKWVIITGKQNRNTVKLKAGIPFSKLLFRGFRSLEFPGNKRL
jgi:hypothetical protein